MAGLIEGPAILFALRPVGIKLLSGAFALTLADRPFAGGEDAILGAADALVGMQSFEDEFCRRDDGFVRLALARADLLGLLQKALDHFEALESVMGTGVVGERDLAAEFEPLHDLLEIAVAEVSI